MFSVLAKMLLLPVCELDGKDHVCPYQGDKSTLGAKLFLKNGSAHRHFLEELHEVWIFFFFLEVVLLRQEFPQLLFNLKMLTQCLAQCFTQNFNLKISRALGMTQSAEAKIPPSLKKCLEET